MNTKEKTQYLTETDLELEDDYNKEWLVKIKKKWGLLGINVDL